MCVTDRHDMTLAVEMALVLNTTNQPIPKWVENIVGKGEIARYEQFLLFPLCFPKRLLLQTRKNQGLFGKGLRLYRKLTGV